MDGAQKKLAWFGAMALVSVLVISFVPTAFHLGGYEFRKVDFAADVKREKNVPVVTGNEDSSSSTTTINQPVNRNLPDFLSYKEIINYSPSGAAPVGKFVQALKDMQQGKRKTVRIAYLGDSFIEADIITMDLRQLLQAKFGVQGVGFMPIMAVAASYRQTIVHAFSKNWYDFNFRSSGDHSTEFMSGHNYSSRGSWVQYAIPGSEKKDTLFKNAYLLYKSSNPITVTVNDSVMSLPATPQIRKELLAQNVSKLQTTFPPNADTIYGYSFEADSGVTVDNFSFRGISGTELQALVPSFLSEINAVHPYDLIIFQYGPNLLYKPEIENFEYYVKPMVKAVSQFRDAFPQADVLMVSTGDKAFRYNGQYATAKGVLPLLKKQQQIAQQSNVNFWNFFLNMGGEGSMIQWVEGDTTFANKDYTHVNFKGGKKIATLLFNALMNAYQYKK